MDNEKEAVTAEVKEETKVEVEPTLTLSQAEAMISKRVKEELKKFSDAAKPAPEEDKTSVGPMKKMQAELESLRAEREAEKVAKFDSQLRSTVKDALLKNNVPSNMVKFAVAHLVDGDKLIKFNEDGELVYADPRFGDFDVEKGIKQFLQSEDGKAFQAPKGAQGSGDRTYRPGAPTKAGASLHDLLEDAYRSGDL